MQRYWAVLFVALLMLSGCGANSSTHGTEKDIRVDVNIVNHGAGSITLTSPLDLVSESATDQETAGTATSTPTLRLQLTEGASTAAQGAAKLKDISNVLRPAAPAVPKLGATPVEKKPVEVEIPAVLDVPVTSVEPKPTEPKSGIPDSDEVYVNPPITSESTDLAYKNQTTYTSYGVRNDRQAWRIANKGPEFGQPIKLVFSSGKEFVVKNTSKNCRGANPDACDTPSDKNKDGFVFKPGIGPNGEGDSDTGTSHGGVYLQAPWNDNSKTVTIHYNKP